MLENSYNILSMKIPVENLQKEIKRKNNITDQLLLQISRKFQHKTLVIHSLKYQ